MTIFKHIPSVHDELEMSWSEWCRYCLLKGRCPGSVHGRADHISSTDTLHMLYCFKYRLTAVASEWALDGNSHWIIEHVLFVVCFFDGFVFSSVLVASRICSTNSLLIFIISVFMSISPLRTCAACLFTASRYSTLNQCHIVLRAVRGDAV